MLGGMIGPQVEALAITPAASWAEYPSSDHGRDQDTSHAGRACLRGAGNAAEKHAGYDACVGKAAGQPADQQHGKADELFRDAASVHDLASKHKERDCQQRQTANAIKYGV